MFDYIKKNWVGLLSCVIGVELIGFISGFFSQGSPEVYSGLLKPPFSPPGALFGIVWPILYALLGISLYRIYSTKNTAARKTALIIFAIQLIVNVFWPLVFFMLMSYFAAALVLIILDILVVIMVFRFNDIDRPAALMQIPYLIWVLYATYLNIGIVFLN